MCVPQEDRCTQGDVERLVDAFPGQSIDFFGALRARVYDDKVGGAGGPPCNNARAVLADVCWLTCDVSGLGCLGLSLLDLAGSGWLDVLFFDLLILILPLTPLLPQPSCPPHIEIT